MQDVIRQTVNPWKSSSFHLRKKSYHVAKENINKIYLLPFKGRKEVKLAIFQHNILATNSILYKVKKVASPSCSFCPSDSQDMCHLFISCKQESSLRENFQNWYSTVSNASLLLSEPEVLFGITRPCTHRLTLNHHIMLGKSFLYIKALNNTMFVFSDLISLVHDKIEIEKYIIFQPRWMARRDFNRSGKACRLEIYCDFFCTLFL